MTHHSWPLAVIQEGYQIQWNSTPRKWRYNPMKSASEEERLAVDQAVDKFISAGL